MSGLLRATTARLPAAVLPLLLALLLTLPAAGRGATSMPLTDKIAITADSMASDPAKRTVTATGNVSLTWQGMTLTAGRVVYDQSDSTLAADGDVVITKGDDTLRGQTVRLNLETGRGELEHAVLNVPSSRITMSGEKIVRQSDEEYTLTDTELTTCDLPDPSWKFSAGSLYVNTLGYATGRHVVFYIKDAPVAYIPWIAFPVVRERTTGLLMPRFGASGRRGAQLDLPFYWVISPSQDALIDLDIQTKRGVGTGLEYRYIRTRGSEGSISGYQIYDLLQDRWRGQLSQNHKEIFSPDMNLRTSVNLNSDRSFLNDFGEKSGEYNRQTSDTIVNALKTWQNFALTGHLRYSQDYYAASNSNTLQTMPEIGLAAVRQPLFSTPLFLDLDATLTNFQRDTGQSGQRGHLFPRLSYSGGLPGYLNLSLFGGLHLRGYTTDRGSVAGRNESDGDLLPEFGLRASSSLVRLYDVDGQSLKKLRHELTPEVSYGLVPRRGQDRLPFYDYTDRMIWQNTAWLSITSTLDGKFVAGDTAAYRDISRIRLSQGYSFSGERRDLLTMVDTRRPWSDLILESDTRLNDYARLTFDARFDHRDVTFTSVMPGVDYDDRQGSFAGISYRMARTQLEYLEGRLGTRRFRPWTFGYTTRYSFDRGDILESVYTVEYHHKCWSVSLAFRDRPGNSSFTVNFNLAGLTSGIGDR